MKFDLIIGNPPYKDIYSGGPEISIYQNFVYMALKLNSEYMSFMIPSKWLTASKRNLIDLKEALVKDGHMRMYVDYLDSYMILDTEQRIQGGCGFFLYDRGYIGECVFAHLGEQGWSVDNRDLRRYDVIVRDPLVDTIIEKLNIQPGKTLSLLINSKELGLSENIEEIQSNQSIANNIKVYTQNSIGYISKKSVKNKDDQLPYYSVLIHLTNINKDYYGVKHINFDTIVKSPMEAYTKHYISIGKFNTCIEAYSLETYLNTNLVRFIINNTTSDTTLNKDKFQMIPIVEFDRIWTDEAIEARFNLTEDEVDLINNNNNQQN